MRILSHVLRWESFLVGLAIGFMVAYKWEIGALSLTEMIVGFNCAFLLMIWSEVKNIQIIIEDK